MSDHIEVDGKRYYEESYLTLSNNTARRIDKENTLFRRLLWLRHGCPIHALYGDDGKMDCNRCMIDFKRDSAADIEARFRRINSERLAPKPAEPPAYDPALLSCIIVDIDGTVAKMNGRGPFEWDKVGTDLPNGPVVSIVRMFYGDGENIIFVSGRDGSCEKLTNEWLWQNVIDDEDVPLFMRPAGDCRDDRIIKQEIYEREIKGKYNVRFVLDDRAKVVDMWRGLGLTCLQVAPGDF